MYHAPGSMDVDGQTQDSAALGDEALTPDVGSDRLRQAHLHNGQARTRALFAPYLAITVVGATLLVVWSLIGSTNVELLLGWAAVVVFANWVICRRAIEQDGTGRAPVGDGATGCMTLP